MKAKPENYYIYFEFVELHCPMHLFDLARSPLLTFI